MDYIPSDICFKNRTGYRIGKQFGYDVENEAFDEAMRGVKRRKAYNGQPVPLKFETKPKSRNIVRDTIRHAALNEDALNDEYLREYYSAAGMC